MRRIAPAVAIALLMAACYSVSPSPPSVPTGAWGGDHIAIVVTSVGAEVNFDCGRGSITNPLTLDNRQQFDAVGSFTAEGGPTPVSQPSRPARYSGRLQGASSITLSVTLTDTQQVIGTFDLALGRSASIVKCQ